MARTLPQILEQINTEADKQNALHDLQHNSSRVSTWHAVKQVVAFTIHTLETYYDLFLARMQHILEQHQVGTLGWYAHKAKQYQQGHPLILSNLQSTYHKRILEDNPDFDKVRIVRKVAVSQNTSTGTITLKVLKKDNTPLSTKEQASFNTYMQDLSFAGIKVAINSLPPEDLTLHATIQVNALLLDTDGIKVGDTKPVEQALKHYLQNLPFNGIIRRTALVDAIQSTQGVIDVKLNRFTYINKSNVAQHYTTTFQPTSGHALLKTQRITYQTNLIT